MTSDVITILGLVLGIIGLIATLVGTYFTYISFINPLVRFRKYLRHTEDWEEFQHIENNLTIYRHKEYPQFQIVTDWNKVLVEGFQEEWINQDLYPDKTNNASHYVRLEVNSMLLDKEMFVSLDGHRYFVPVPKILSLEHSERAFYYDQQQVQLAKIVGKFHFEKDIYHFAKSCKEPIGIKE